MKIERFWNKVHKTKSCWVYTGGTDSWGYGQINVDGKTVKTHRFSWELHEGRKIPLGYFVLHKCDNPPCINPSHLFLGTNQDNMDDKMAKGRHVANGKPPHVPGEKNGQHILTERQVRQIRKEFSGKHGDKTRLGKKFGVTRHAIHSVIIRKNWRHF